mmetsp:Transcript_74058/g.220991  ORF Transcript_74058/g.220991 Transcript_74058/m.220991 type:complete len:363 (-) Transcript_74058:660-1748(-)
MPTPLAALLLAPVFALSVGTDLSIQDKDACTGGVEGACLAGLAMPDSDAEKDEAAFLQDRSRRSGASWAAGFPDDDYLTVVQGINDTVSAVQRAIDLVSSTVAETTATLQAQSGTLIGGFSLAKTTAEKAKFLLGEKIVKAVEDFVDKMSNITTMFVSTAILTGSQAEDEVQKLWAAFLQKKDEVLDKITAAEKQMQEIPGKNASLLQARAHTSSDGFWDWLRHLFGGGKRRTESKCEMAQESLSAANSSALEFESLVGMLDSQVGSDYLDSCVKNLGDSVGGLQSTVQLAISSLGDSMPAAVKSVVDKAMSRFTSVVDSVKKQLEPAKRRIKEFLGQTRSPLQTVRNALDSSGSALAAKCQ